MNCFIFHPVLRLAKNLRCELREQEIGVDANTKDLILEKVEILISTFSVIIISICQLGVPKDKLFI